MKFVSPSQLDQKNPGTWPIYYKIIIWIMIVVVIIGFFYQFFVTDLNSQQEANIKQIEDNQRQYKQLFQDTLDLDQYKQRKQELLAQLEKLLTYLPETNEVDKLIEDVYKSSLDSGINMTSYSPVRPYIRRPYYDIAPVNLSTTTYYTNFAKISQILTQLTRIMNIADFNLTVYPEAGGQKVGDLFSDNAIVVNAQLQTYIYNQNIEDLRAGKVPQNKNGGGK